MIIKFKNLLDDLMAIKIPQLGITLDCGEKKVNSSGKRQNQVFPQKFTTKHHHNTLEIIF